MSSLEDQLKQYSMDPSGHVELAPIKDILAPYTLKSVGSGIASKVFRLEGTPWVMKEGRWDPEIEIGGVVKLRLPGHTLHTVLSPLSSSFLPTLEYVQKAHQLYLVSEAYFGFGSTDPVVRHDQEVVRGKLAGEFSDSALRHNFLPTEHLLFGPALSDHAKGKPTSFLFQEFVPGTMLHDTAFESISTRDRELLRLFVRLALLLHDEKGLLPDTRPRYPLLEGTDWFLHTDNILLTDTGPRYIDTRWFWEKGLHPLKRGVIIVELTLNAYKRALKKLRP